MDIQLTADRIFLVGGYTDMRKSIDGLAAVVSQRFELDSFRLSLFLFCGRRREYSAVGVPPVRQGVPLAIFR